MVLYIFHIVIGFLVLISTIVMTFWFKTNRILKQSNHTKGYKQIEISGEKKRFIELRN